MSEKTRAALAVDAEILGSRAVFERAGLRVSAFPVPVQLKRNEFIVNRVGYRFLPDKCAGCSGTGHQKGAACDGCFSTGLMCVIFGVLAGSAPDPEGETP